MSMPTVNRRDVLAGAGAFVLGFLLGAVALFGLALYASLKGF